MSNEMIGVKSAVDLLMENPAWGMGVSTIKAIQLDAYNAGRKAGMREAAVICFDQQTLRTIRQLRVDGALDCQLAILTAADAKEGK
jgi:hypothetical protein